MRLLQRRFSVGVSTAKAWSHLAAVASWPSWARHIRNIELAPPGELTPQTAGVLRLTNGIRSTFRMTELNPGVNWKWSGGFLWLTVDYDHRFHRVADDRCEIEFIIDGRGFGVSVLGPVFASIYAKNLDIAIPRLVAELETQR
jgi:hypothetical protein